VAPPVAELPETPGERPVPYYGMTWHLCNAPQPQLGVTHLWFVKYGSLQHQRSLLVATGHHHAPCIAYAGVRLVIITCSGYQKWAGKPFRVIDMRRHRHCPRASVVWVHLIGLDGHCSEYLIPWGPQHTPGKSTCTWGCKAGSELSEPPAQVWPILPSTLCAIVAVYCLCTYRKEWATVTVKTGVMHSIVRQLSSTQTC
jgi:hypothetical protein